MTRLALLAVLLLSGCQGMTLDLSNIRTLSILETVAGDRPIEFEVTLIRIPF